MSLADLMALQDQSDLSGTPMGQGLNTAGMANNQRNNSRSGTPRPPRPRRVTATGDAEPMIDYPEAMAAAHFGRGEQLAKNANDIIQEEMDRRVSISREQRRQAVELEKKRMDQETERMKTEALLKRLAMEQDMANGITTIYH